MIGKINLYIYAVVISSTIFSCKKNNTADGEACYQDRKIVKIAKNIRGVVSILDSKHPNTWSIKSRQGIIGSPGPTYDSFDIIIPCNLPNNFKKEGLLVFFSGALKDPNKDFKNSADSIYYADVYYSQLDEIKIME